MGAGICENCGRTRNIGPNGLCEDCDSNLEADQWKPLFERLERLEAGEGLRIKGELARIDRQVKTINRFTAYRFRVHETRAPIEDRSGKKRRSWVLRMVLSYSRKAYSEAVTKQDTETFLRCLENGLRSFGGCPLLLNLDNMKSAVLKADWFDPEINPKLADFCRHYGLHVVPCRPAMPQHKGKVERGVAYLRSNALKGRRFGCLAEENLFLEHWESNIADKRIHGTTRKQVAACFAEERPHLQPLPVSLFPCFQEARRSVHRDSYVEVEKAFYEAPPELIGPRGLGAMGQSLRADLQRADGTSPDPYPQGAGSV